MGFDVTSRQGAVGGVAAEDASSDMQPAVEPGADTHDAQTRGPERGPGGPSIWQTLLLFVASAAVITVLILLTPP
ncbi:MAG: hypothetical protein WB784_01975 [Rhodanobacteraceae bacterium]